MNPEDPMANLDNARNHLCTEFTEMYAELVLVKNRLQYLERLASQVDARLIEPVKEALFCVGGAKVSLNALIRVTQ